jgi:hypothetical protein
MPYSEIILPFSIFSTVVISAIIILFIRFLIESNKKK